MKSRIKIISVFALAAIIGITSCKQEGSSADSGRHDRSDRIAVNEGGVVLRIEDADLLQVDYNPQYNTAEWQFTVEEPGRYEVWLSSLTCDTSHLRFADNVIITAGDTRLTKRPVGDHIVMNDKSVHKPWYRADSHMGSIFFSQPGEYQVQVISDRVEPHTSDVSRLSVDKHTLINSVILKPMVN